jgi:hypothetical protein
MVGVDGRHLPDRVAPGFGLRRLGVEGAVLGAAIDINPGQNPNIPEFPYPIRLVNWLVSK